MGRHVKPRGGSYNQDATVILRIATAVEEDSTVTQSWRDEVSEKLREVARDLLSPVGVPMSMGRGKSGG